MDSKHFPPPQQSGDRYGSHHERIPEFDGYGVDSDQLGFGPLPCPESKPGEAAKMATDASDPPRKT